MDAKELRAIRKALRGMREPERGSMLEKIAPDKQIRPYLKPFMEINGMGEKGAAQVIVALYSYMERHGMTEQFFLGDKE